MIQNEVYDQSDARLFIQPDGPNTASEYLGCHNLEDITKDRGTIEHRHRVRPDGAGYILYKTAKGPQGVPATTITTPLRKTADWLERIVCPTTIYVHKGKCGDKRPFLNYERSWILRYSDINSETLAGMAMGFDVATPATSTRAFAINPQDITDIFKPVPTRQVTTEDQSLRSVWFANSARCAPYCGAASLVCEQGMAVAEADTGLTANVLYTLDGGATWTACAVDPFAADEHIASVCGFYTADGETIRWLVARGSTDAGNPYEIAWTDDLGATWNTVNVGATNGEYALWGRALWCIDHRHIWTVTDQGAIYFSQDGGLTWAAQPTTNASALWGCKFCDENYGVAHGAANTILFTRDGGAHWNALTGPAAQAAVVVRSAEILDNKRILLGYGDGELWYAVDVAEDMVSGDWSQRTVDLPTGAVSTSYVNDVMAPRWGGYPFDHVIWMCSRWEDGDADQHGAVYRSFNGGFDWEIWYTADLDATANHGLAALWACGANQAFSVGDPITTSYIMEVSSPQPTLV